MYTYTAGMESPDQTKQMELGWAGPSMPTYPREVPYSFETYKHIVSGGDTDHAVLVIMWVWIIAVRVQAFVPCFKTDAFDGYVYTCTVCVYMCVYVYIYIYIYIYNVCSVLPL